MLSDALISPSEYLVHWIRQAGWNLPEKIDIIPYYMQAKDLLGAKTNFGKKTNLSLGRHIVFFGRLEERKGLSLFLRSLASEALAARRFKLTFLGRPETKSINEIRESVSRARPDLVEELEFKPDCSSDEAQEFLLTHECVAVIPSLVDNSPCVIYEGYFHEIYGVTHEDWELHLRWALGGCKLLSLPQPLLWYRVAPGSMIRSTSRYSNLRVVAATIQENISPQLRPILDLLVGTQVL